MSRSQSCNRSVVSRIFTDVEELTDADLIKQVNNLKEEVNILRIENEVLERTLTRLDPNLLNGLQAAYDYATKLQSSGSLGAGSFLRSKTSTFGLADSLNSPSRMLASPSRISTRRAESSARLAGTVVLGTAHRVNILERSELITAELEILISNLEKVRMKAAKKQALLKAQIEEIGVREADYERATEDFKKLVLEDGWDTIAQRIPAEIWIRFMTEWVKICDSQIGKLRLRTSTLNTQFYKLKGQIKQKTELSESLRPVDFEKLQIENSICQDIIDEKIHHLVDLKKLTGDANLNLTIHKKAMNEQTNYLTLIYNTIKNKQRQMTDLVKETEIIQGEAKYYQNKLDKIKEIRNAYEVPDIMDYVLVKAEVADLKRSITLLHNRYHIHEIALASINKSLNNVKG